MTIQEQIAQMLRNMPLGTTLDDVAAEVIRLMEWARRADFLNDKLTLPPDGWQP